MVLEGSAVIKVFSKASGCHVNYVYVVECQL